MAIFKIYYTSGNRVYIASFTGQISIRNDGVVDLVFPKKYAMAIKEIDKRGGGS